MPGLHDRSSVAAGEGFSGGGDGVGLGSEESHRRNYQAPPMSRDGGGCRPRGLPRIPPPAARPRSGRHALPRNREGSATATRSSSTFHRTGSRRKWRTSSAVGVRSHSTPCGTMRILLESGAQAQSAVPVSGGLVERPPVSVPSAKSTETWDAFAYDPPESDPPAIWRNRLAGPPRHWFAATSLVNRCVSFTAIGVHDPELAAVVLGARLD